MLKKMLVALLMLALPVAANAAEVTLSDVIKTLETPFNSQTAKKYQISDFSADFSQQSHVASINRVQHGAGSVRFRFIAASAQENAMAQFRWDYQQPDIQEIISDGKKMWVYLPDNKQVIESDISRLSEDQGENPVTFLSRLGNLSQGFEISWGSESRDVDGNYLLQLKPRQASQLIDQMAVVVNQVAVEQWLKSHKTGEIFPIVATIVTDFQGNRTAIQFDKVKLNRSLEANLFQFEKPDDVELIRPDQLSYQ